MQFAYLRDPLFIASLSLYAANRWWIKPGVAPGTFLHAHLNDLICIPFLVPPMLLIARRLGWRDHDRPPRVHEIIVPLIVWSVLFEIVFPRHAFWGQWTTGDHRDVLWYALGAMIAVVFWNARYRVTADRASAKTAESFVRRKGRRGVSVSGPDCGGSPTRGRAN